MVTHDAAPGRREVEGWMSSIKAHRTRTVSKPGRVTRPVAAAYLLAVIAGASPGTAARAALTSTALQVAAVGVPQRVHGSDGREHIDYDLVITNAFTSEVTLTSFAVTAGGK